MAKDTTELQAQIDELKQQVAALTGGTAVPAAEASEPVAVSRRGALGKAAAIAAGAMGGAILLERPAAAANGDAVVAGQSVSATTATSIISPTTSSGASKLSLLVYDGSSYTSASSAFQATVGAWSDTHYGLYAFSGSGYPAVFSSGRGVQIAYGSPSITALSQAVPTSGAHSVGEYVLTSGTGSISTCIVAGSPGTWANIGFNPTTGAARVLDTRTGTGAPTARFNSGEAHTVAVRGHATIPDSTSVRAVSYSITVNTPGGNGYLKIGPDASSQATVVNFTKGVSISASGITGLAADGSVVVKVLGASADVVIDLTGYFV